VGLLRLQVTEEDIKQAYTVHLKPGHWYLDPKNTPIALALKRTISDGVDIEVCYDTITLSRGADRPLGRATKALPKEARQYQTNFGLSLYKNIDPHRASVLKKLHETSSNHAVELVMVKTVDRVKPIEFELDI
jgi:hypothetical protein